VLDSGDDHATVQHHYGVHEHGRRLFDRRRGTRTDAHTERRPAGRHTAVPIGRSTDCGGGGSGGDVDTGDRAGGGITTTTRFAAAAQQQRERLQQGSEIR